jgi:hypothetical protein
MLTLHRTLFKIPETKVFKLAIKLEQGSFKNVLFFTLGTTHDFPIINLKKENKSNLLGIGCKILWRKKVVTNTI